MRRFTVVSLVAVFAILSVMAWAAGPETSPMTGTTQMGTAGQGMEKTTSAYTPEILKAKELIGMKVENQQAEHLGKIEDIVLTRDRERVAYAVLTYGGVLGMGEKYFAVPWPALESKTGEKALILNKDKESLKNAPGFDKSKWPNMASAEWGRAIHEFYGKEPRAERRAERRVERSQQIGEATMGSEQMTDRRVSKLLGMKVENAQNQKVGEIKDLAIDTHQGDVVFGIISLAKNAPSGADMAAIPWSSLTIQPQTKTAMLDVAKTTLDTVAFKESQYPNLASRDFTQRTYQQFNRQPYWDVYGYTAPGAEAKEHPMMAEMGAGWAATSDWNKKFDPAKVSTISGSVETVGSFEPQAGSRPGVQVTVKSDDGRTVTAQLAPQAFLRRQNMTLAAGEKVTIKGCTAEVNGQSVFIASEITKGGQTIQLRDEKGTPAWHMGSMMQRGMQMRGMQMQRGSQMERSGEPSGKATQPTQ